MVAVTPFGVVGASGGVEAESMLAAEVAAPVAVPMVTAVPAVAVELI